MVFPKRHSANDTNIFTEVQRWSVQHAAIDLSQGCPDYPLNNRLKDLLVDSTQINVNEFASTAVLPILIENIIKFNQKRKLPLIISENEITIVPGATYGIYVAFATFLEPDDEVIILEPCYETYLPAVEIKKAKAIFVSLTADFEPDWQKIKEAISPKTKAIIVNSPHNPSGKIWTENDWETLWEMIKDTEIIVISDEVYDLIIYPEKNWKSAYHHKGLKQRTFCIFSFEKMFHISGWKTSYIIAPENFTTAFQKIHQYLIFSVNIYSQYALAKYLEVFDVEENAVFFEKKKNLLLSLTADLPITPLITADGGYFQSYNFHGFTKHRSDKDFVKLLIEDAKVAGIPYSAFYHDRRNTGNIRFCFAKKDDTITKAAQNLRNFFLKQ